jgi:hypothetical protein
VCPYNSGILDQYQLKSLDNVLEKMPFEHFNMTNVTIQYQEEDGVGVTRTVNASELRVHFTRIIDMRDRPDLRDRPIEERKWGKFGMQDVHTQETHPVTGHHMCSPDNACFAYDAVVCALGWVFDTSIFGGRNNKSNDDDDDDDDDDTKEKKKNETKDEEDAETLDSVPRLNLPFEMDIARPDKYPAMTAHYESSNVPGLFFAGAVGHARDYRKAAGGFIHGFRYTAQALVKDLLRRFHGEPWPSRVMTSKPSPWWGPCTG